MKNDFYQPLMDYAFRLLGGCAYSEEKLHQKLALRARKLKLDKPAPLLEKITARLKELNYLNDDRLLNDYFEYRLKNRPVGKFLFLHDMHRRGIPIKKARAEWEKRNMDELPLAKELLSQKGRQFEKLPPVLRKNKIVRFLASRGFSPETVWELADS